jgi:hypothetical protein
VVRRVIAEGSTDEYEHGGAIGLHAELGAKLGCMLDYLAESTIQAEIRSPVIENGPHSGQGSSDGQPCCLHLVDPGVHQPLSAELLYRILGRGPGL